MFSCVDFINLFYNMAVIVLYFFLYTNFLIMQLYVVKVSIEKKNQITKY